jgi:hypothetical protein
MSEVYFRLPDRLVLVTDHHKVEGASTFELTMRGIVRDYAEAEGKVFWLLEPNFVKMKPEDFVLEVIDES